MRLLWQGGHRPSAGKKVRQGKGVLESQVLTHTDRIRISWIGRYELPVCCVRFSFSARTVTTLRTFFASFPETKVDTHTRILGKVRALYLTCGSTPLVLFISTTKSGTSEPHGDPLAPICHIFAGQEGRKGGGGGCAAHALAIHEADEFGTVTNTRCVQSVRASCAGVSRHCGEGFPCAGQSFLSIALGLFWRAMCGNGMVLGSPPCPSSMILRMPEAIQVTCSARNKTQMAIPTRLG